MAVTPFFSQEQIAEIIKNVQTKAPIEHGLPGYGWTLKKLKRWVKQVFKYDVSRNFLRTLLKANSLSWKKCQKLLGKAKPEKRQAYIQQFQEYFLQLYRGAIRIIYIDEAQFHRNLDLGYTWATKGEPTWCVSDCPHLADRINWYGAYDFSYEQCFIWNEGNCNGNNTVKFSHRLKPWTGQSNIPVIIIWDGAP